MCFRERKNVQIRTTQANESQHQTISLFSILFSIHFLRCWQGESVEQSRASLGQEIQLQITEDGEMTNFLTKYVSGNIFRQV